MEVKPPIQGFQASVTVFGQTYVGLVQRQKKLAQQSAAAHALHALQSSDVLGGMPIPPKKPAAKPVDSSNEAAAALFAPAAKDRASSPREIHVRKVRLWPGEKVSMAPFR